MEYSVSENHLASPEYQTVIPFIYVSIVLTMKVFYKLKNTRFDKL